MEVWARAFPLVKEFPLFGTGWGTFGHIEQTRRLPGDDPYVFNDHAHNDFLELWIEGGTIQLLIVIAVIALVFRAGIRAASQLGDTGLGRLALGALLAVVAVVFHSFVDFGMHIPAVAVLAAVVGGLLMNLADVPPPVRSVGQAASLPRTVAPKRKPASCSTVAPTPPSSMAMAGLEATALFIVAWYLVGAGWSDQQAERYLWASTHAPLNRKITYLTEAVAFSPDRAELYKELVDVLVESYFERKKVRDWADAAALVGGASGCPYPGVLAFCDRSAIRIPNKELSLANDLLVHACRNNPLFFDAQVRLERISAIGALRAFKGKRLERLTFLSPSDPEPWFLAGKEALRMPDKGVLPGPDKAKAFSSFRNSLLADKKYLADIVALIPEQMSSSELLREVLPAAPPVIMETAKLVAKQSGNSDDGMPFYKEALRVLDGKGRALSDAEWMEKARAQVGLEDDEAAQKSFEQALSQSTQNAYWRYEYCELLSRRGQFREAHKQLGIVLHQAPQYHAARLLLNKVLKEDLH
jgi:tetratricopeptide (TPR) repeat protein